MEKREIKLNNTITDLKIDTQSADILVRSDNIDEPIAILTGEFDVKDDKRKPQIKELTSNTSFKTNSGSVRIGNITILSNVSVNGVVISSGNTGSYVEIVLPRKFRDLNLSVDTKSGDISIRNLVLGKLVVDSMSGDVTLNDVDFLSANIDTMSGDVVAEVSNSMSNFKTKLDTMSGDIKKEDLEDHTTPSLNMNINSNADKHNLKVDTMSGDIKVLFKGRKK